MTWIEDLVIKIGIITGWAVPSEPIYDALLDQLGKKLMEDFGDMNIEEIEYAFRRSANTKDWGKEINLGFVDEVLGTYLSERMRASAAEEHLKRNPPKQRIYTEEEILNERRGDIEAAYQVLRKKKMSVLHIYFKEVLVQDGLMPEDMELEQFLSNKLEAGVTALYEK